MGYRTLWILLLLILTACGASKHRPAKKHLNRVMTGNTFDNQFTGMFVLDPTTRDTIYGYNSEKYFTPASTTKIFTLFTAMTLLPEHLPSVKYLVKNDTLYVEGTGDPTLLHPYFKERKALDFMKHFDHIALYFDNVNDSPFGPGWAWDDYDTYYSPERSAFPLYGNVVSVMPGSELKVSPNIFEYDTYTEGKRNLRALTGNRFYIPADIKKTIEIPFITDSVSVRRLFEQALQREVRTVKRFPDGKKDVIFGQTADSVYQRMMYVSDNFLAEQLLILASSRISDTLSSEKARNYILENELSDLKHVPRWVDGSGLSRYNLFTPESMVHVLYKLYRAYPEERLFNLFPTGGLSGTLKSSYKAATPYVIAKTGTLSNNHSLSGFLKTRSGKTLIFSIMNNHYRHGSNPVKKEMEAVLLWIRDRY